MKKKVTFKFNNPKGINVSKDRKLVFMCDMFSEGYYSLEELNLIFEKLKNTKFSIELNIEKNDKDKKEKIKCGECKFYNKEYGCLNSASKAKGKRVKTSNSKGCVWNEII